MRVFFSMIVAFCILYTVDALFTGGKYSQSAAAMGRSMAMHFGLR